MSNVISLSGATRSDLDRLRQAGIRTTEQLLEAGATSIGRMNLADRTLLSDATIKQWVHQADLMRVRGIRPDFAQVLYGMGISTLPKLAYQQVNLLHAQLSRYATYHHLSVALPSLSQLRGYIAQARHMPKLVQH